MSGSKITAATALLVLAVSVSGAWAQCYRGQSLTSGPDGKTPNGFGSESTNPACDESARKYPNSFGANSDFGSRSAPTARVVNADRKLGQTLGVSN